MKYTKLVAFGLTGALLLAACGDDDETTQTEPEEDGGGGGEATPVAAPLALDPEGSPEFTAPPADTTATLRVWLNGPDTPQAMRDLAVQRFREQYPNVTVNIEEQEWEGVVDRLTATLGTSDTPDIAEFGNTQIQQYEAAGALVDLTTVFEDFGSDDLTDSLVEAGSYDQKLYGVPLYGGARVVVYRTDLFEESGLEIPTTLEEFVEAGKTLKQDNEDVENFSGIYWPGRDWRAMLAFIWDNGGDIATQTEGGEWEGQLTSGASIEALETVQEVMEDANGAPADATEENDFEEFCAGEIGMLMGPGWKMGQILDEDDGCPEEMEGKVGAFALPGSSEDTAPVFLGGSLLGVSTQSQNQALAVEFLKFIASEEFQLEYARAGLLPARKSLLDSVEGDEAAQAQALAAQITRFTPNSVFWAEVEGQEILEDMGTALGEGESVEDAAAQAEEAIVEILNGG